MSKSMMLYPKFMSEWIKYSNYILKKNQKGESYIVPDSEAKYEIYNPFDKSNSLIADIINLGFSIQDKRKEDAEKEIEELTLKFIKKYGLIGFAGASALNRNIIGEEKILLIDNNFIEKKGLVDGEEYVKMFTPFIEKWEIVIRKYKEAYDLFKAEDSPKFYGKKPLIMDLIFSKFYAEKISWIANFAEMISMHYKEVLIYKKNSLFLTQPVTILANQFRAGKIEFTITQGKSTNIAWEFDSLKTTIETIYAFIITDENFLLKQCIHCGRVFHSENKKKVYCDESCRNRANVYKSRMKDKISKINQEQL